MRRRTLLLGALTAPPATHALPPGSAPALPAGSVPPALPPGAECIAPAKPGGGFDLSCRLAQAALQQADAARPLLPIRYLPGGIGALAYRTALTQRAADAAALVAFSSGTLLNLVQGRFGPTPPREVRWLAAPGFDHGVIAVNRAAPWPTLGALVEALRAQPNAIVFGAGGTIGSQDWMKAALLARSAGVGHRTMRFVAFEGGGEAVGALAGRHVQVLAGDAAELAHQQDAGAPVRVLAVLADRRLPGRWAAVPTAREQGFDIRWPILRGFYLGPAVDDAAYHTWSAAFEAAFAAPGFAALRQRAGLEAPSLIGTPLQDFVQRQLADYRALTDSFGLPRRAA
ncbi:tripartite tricarboxylate transporter substrate binding protein [Aquincola sp. S2]|uniref:Tripartite tricarboxylate transporter substrate binding protein n=2 Tax=Pseudaquabacterium terrae TaxID=2732868 RepID=A0ABX2E9N9_9BURK|nr:tripartite tricarboxylate transporter substrate binding protein [Aquabacterium terrae]